MMEIGYSRCLHSVRLTALSNESIYSRFIMSINFDKASISDKVELQNNEINGLISFTFRYIGWLTINCV